MTSLDQLADQSWTLPDRVLDLTRPICAGIVNVTADSMWEGARSATPEQAVDDGKHLAELGFDLIDVGAVPARRGPPVPAEVEAAALVPAIEGLAASGLPICADTFSPTVAARALAAGAAVINDIGGGEPEMLDLVASSGCGYVLMHIEGPPREDRPTPDYDDPVDRLKSWFGERLEEARRRGVDDDQIVLDPGLDFDLSVDHDLEILCRLPELALLGRPLYVSLSRKDFIGAVLAGSWEDRLDASDREWGTVAAAALAVAGGARILRLHDESALQAVRVAAAIVSADGE